MIEYICIPNPENGDSDEEEDGDGDEEEEEKSNQEDPNGPKFGDSPEQHPGYKWIITRAVHDLLIKYNIDADLRDQDLIGCYFYNDFTGYGLHEVVDNIMQTVQNEFVSKEFDIHRFWVHIQALAVWMYSMGCRFAWSSVFLSVTSNSTPTNNKQ